jgi:hypothetical protein
MNKEALEAMEEALLAFQKIKVARWLKLAAAPEVSAVDIADEASKKLKMSISKFKQGGRDD